MSAVQCDLGEKPALRHLTGQAEALALWVLRRAAGSTRLCDADTPPGPFKSELLTIAAAFRALFDVTGTNDPLHVQIAMSDTASLTKDERRLLRAVAAAQNEDSELLDTFVHKLAMGRGGRRHLAGVITNLAACLAVQGYWLPRPTELIPVPGPALTVALAHGRNMQTVRVAWP